MSDATALPSTSVASSETTAPRVEFDWRKIIDTSEGRISIAVFASVCFAFWGLLQAVSKIWFEPDSLYSYGPLVPFFAGYIVFERWGKLREIPVKGASWAFIPLAFVMYITWFASRTVLPGVQSSLFMLALAFSILFIGGWRWFVATLGPLLYLVFALPFWTGIVDKFTQPLQALSTDMALQILTLFGMRPYRSDVTTIYLDHFQFNVAAACSGSKTTLALLAFAVFFILLNRGRWYSAVALLALLLPFSLMVNGLRIALVGVVGNAFGSDAGMMFHDYGGYVVVILCFILLGKIARLLGFKQ